MYDNNLTKNNSLQSLNIGSAQNEISFLEQKPVFIFKTAPENHMGGVYVNDPTRQQLEDLPKSLP